MQFLADQDVYQMTVDWLRNQGHDVVTAKELGMERAADEDLLQKAKVLDRRFLTRDKDFGALVFLHKELSAGVILLRVAPTTVEEAHRELGRLLHEWNEEKLRDLFCVVEPHQYRIRRLRSR